MNCTISRMYPKNMQSTTWTTRCTSHPGTANRRTTTTPSSTLPNARSTSTTKTRASRPNSCTSSPACLNRRSRSPVTPAQIQNLVKLTWANLVLPSLVKKGKIWRISIKLVMMCLIIWGVKHIPSTSNFLLKMENRRLRGSWTRIFINWRVSLTMRSKRRVANMRISIRIRAIIGIYHRHLRITFKIIFHLQKWKLSQNQWLREMCKKKHLIKIINQRILIRSWKICRKKILSKIHHMRKRIQVKIS